MDEVISLEEVFKIIKERLSLIISMALLGIGLASVVTFFVMEKQYSAAVQMIAKLPDNDNQVANNVNDVNFNLQMINTYKDIIASDIVLEKVQRVLAETHGIEVTQSDIRSISQVQQNTNSQMFAIQVTTSNPIEAQTIANVQSEVFKQAAIDVLAIDDVSVLSEATVNTKPVSPNRWLNLLIGTVSGLILGIGLAFLAELMNKTIKKESFIEETLGLPQIGTVSQMTGGQQAFRPLIATNSRMRQETNKSS